MTTSTTPPLLTPLPPAPLPTDAEAVFDAKAGASLTAQAVMVGEVNTALGWQADSMAATAGSMTAAAGSAAAAASSASAAAGSVVSAQAQVGLAATQAGNAAASANSAQVAAAAAGSAVGLPSVVGHGGQALVVRKDENGFELKALDQAIGDVLITTRTPDSTYLLPDTVYSRAAYPDLFSVVGIQGEKNDGSNFVATNYGVTPYTAAGVAKGKNNVIISVGYNNGGYTGSTSSVALKSTDFGLTWSPIDSLAGLTAFAAIDTDGNGVWFVMSYNTIGYRSIDNGVTWSSSIIVSGAIGAAASYTIATNRQGVWIATILSNYDWISASRSSDNGLTWSAINMPSYNITAVFANYVTGEFWLRNSSYYLYRSSDTGATQGGWKLYFNNGTSTQVSIPAFNGGVMAFTSNNTLFVSLDNGDTYKTFLGLGGVVLVDSDGVILVSYNGRYYKSFDYGESWSVSLQAVLGVLAYVQSSYVAFHDGVNGIWLVGNGSSFYRSTRLYNYDTSTQFKTPICKSPKGYKAYIKGKLQ